VIPFILVAANLTVGAAVQAAASDERDQYVRASKNGEFLSAFYPAGALKRGEQGRVGFKIAVERGGWISLCEVTQSSGFRALDRETCEIIVQYAKVQPVRTADGKAVRAVQDGYISWRLPRSATKVAVPSARLASRPDPIVCRRDPTAGSLINKTIQCLTAKEWGRQQDFNKDFWQEIQGKGHNGDGG
jgi:TonB family protein